jgi:hypothetical protein
LVISPVLATRAKADQFVDTFALYPFPRSGLPGFAPVCSPLSITTTPFTST